MYKNKHIPPVALKKTMKISSKIVTLVNKVIILTAAKENRKPFELPEASGVRMSSLQKKKGTPALGLCPNKHHGKIEVGLVSVCSYQVLCTNAHKLTTARTKILLCEFLRSDRQIRYLATNINVCPSNTSVCTLFFLVCAFFLGLECNKGESIVLPHPSFV